LVFFLVFFKCWGSEKKKRRRRFDREWGALNTEANIWWRGNGYDEWVDVMGKHWLGWMCESSTLFFLMF